MKTWNKVKEILSEALELDKSERVRYINKACEGDPDLRDEVLSLIDAHEMPGILDRPIDDVRLSAISVAKADRMKGRRIGNYQILKELGHGGMGSVYLAERADGVFEQLVALKLLHSPFATENQLMRFKRERQILASLHHDNIARLKDGGVTEQEQPYYVMEFVNGSPIDSYCDNHQLTVKQRLRLFLDVCRAVQYAHRKLVVHRDLKPSNILVTNDGRVKLLDFGIATMVDNNKRSGAENMLTRPGLLPFTPTYASPEQVRGETISTASDIYQLGIVLYELLSGILPYEVAGLSPTDIQTTICETDAPDPATKMLQVVEQEDIDRIVRNRGTNAQQLQKKLTGDISTVVMMAIRKEPDRRYESAERLGQDIRRYLDNKPVSAHTDTTIYKLTKFVRRNIVETVSALLIFVLLTGYLITITWHNQQTQLALDRAESEAEKSEQVINFMLGMFEAGNPVENLGDTISAGTLLRQGIVRAENLAGQPDIQERMFDVVGRAFYELGEYEQAVPILKQALEIKKENGNSDDISIADHNYILGRAMHHLGDYRKSDQYFNEALEIYQSYSDHESKEYAGSLYMMANIHRVRQNHKLAEELHRRALLMRRRILDEKATEIGDSFRGVGISLYLKGDHEKALTYLNRAEEIYREQYEDMDPKIAELKVEVARVLQSMNQMERAEMNLKEALDIRIQVFGDGHVETGISRKVLADFYRETELYQKAEQIYNDLLAGFDEESVGHHPLRRPVVQATGKLYMESEQPHLAEPYLRETVHLLESVLNPTHPRIIGARNRLAKCLIELEQYGEAEELLVSNLDHFDQPETHIPKKTKTRTAGHLIELYQKLGENEKLNRVSQRLEIPDVSTNNR